MKKSVSSLPQEFMRVLPPDTLATHRKALRLLFQEPSITSAEKLMLSTLFRKNPAMCDQYVVMCETDDTDLEMDDLKATWLEELIERCPRSNQQPIASPFGNLGGTSGVYMGQASGVGQW